MGGLAGSGPLGVERQVVVHRSREIVSRSILKEPALKREPVIRRRIGLCGSSARLNRLRVHVGAARAVKRHGMADLVLVFGHLTRGHALMICLHLEGHAAGDLDGTLVKCAVFVRILSIGGVVDFRTLRSARKLDRLRAHIVAACKRGRGGFHDSIGQNCRNHHVLARHREGHGLILAVALNEVLRIAFPAVDVVLRGGHGHGIPRLENSLALVSGFAIFNQRAIQHIDGIGLLSRIHMDNEFLGFAVRPALILGRRINYPVGLLIIERTHRDAALALSGNFPGVTTVGIGFIRIGNAKAIVCGAARRGEFYVLAILIFVLIRRGLRVRNLLLPIANLPIDIATWHLEFERLVIGGTPPLASGNIPLIAILQLAGGKHVTVILGSKRHDNRIALCERTKQLAVDIHGVDVGVLLVKDGERRIFAWRVVPSRMRGDLLGLAPVGHILKQLRAVAVEIFVPLVPVFRETILILIGIISDGAITIGVIHHAARVAVFGMKLNVGDGRLLFMVVFEEIEGFARLHRDLFAIHLHGEVRLLDLVVSRGRNVVQARIGIALIGVVAVDAAHPCADHIHLMIKHDAIDVVQKRAGHDEIVVSAIVH